MRKITVSVKPKLVKHGKWWHCGCDTYRAVGETFAEAYRLWFQYTRTRY